MVNFLVFIVGMGVGFVGGIFLTVLAIAPLKRTLITNEGKVQE